MKVLHFKNDGEESTIKNRLFNMEIHTHSNSRVSLSTANTRYRDNISEVSHQARLVLAHCPFVIPLQFGTAPGDFLTFHSNFGSSQYKYDVFLGMIFPSMSESGKNRFKAQREEKEHSMYF